MRGRFSRWRLFFKILKTRTNQQPDIYIIPKAYPYPSPYPKIRVKSTGEVISSGEVIFASLNFNSFTTVLLRPSKLLIVFQASVVLFYY